MSDTIEISKGECVHTQGTWTDDTGPIDLTGRTLSIVESYPPALTDGTVTVTDALAGEFEIHIDNPAAASLRSGRVNWIRLAMMLPGECPNTTPRIWIAVL